MNTLLSSVATVSHRIVQWFAYHDINKVYNFYITHPRVKPSSRGCLTHNCFVPGKDKLEDKIDELEGLEEELASRYNMAHAWGIDSVEVINEAKVRALSDTPQYKWELHQMSELYKARRKLVGSSRNKRWVFLRRWRLFWRKVVRASTRRRPWEELDWHSHC
ncbi:hypothetical protein EDD85DRAFT_940152 [Armillaria nabsnona]|nr:hypothetical protein EDD85DRAFT_940152 [Armillaria nabsnona]